MITSCVTHVIWRNWSRWESEFPWSWPESLLSTTFSTKKFIVILSTLCLTVLPDYHPCLPQTIGCSQLYYFKYFTNILSTFRSNLNIMNHDSWSILPQMEQLPGILLKSLFQSYLIMLQSFQASLTNAFKSLLENEDFVDVTLSAGGKTLRAHKVVLSACSSYFKQLLRGKSSVDSEHYRSKD